MLLLLTARRVVPLQQQSFKWGILGSEGKVPNGIHVRALGGEAPPLKYKLFFLWAFAGRLNKPILRRFLPHDATLAWPYMLLSCAYRTLSIRPSVTSRCSTETAKCRITQTSARVRMTNHSQRGRGKAHKKADLEQNSPRQASTEVECC